jgi:hypothetical protein
MKLAGVSFFSFPHVSLTNLPIPVITFTPTFSCLNLEKKRRKKKRMESKKERRHKETRDIWRARGR